MATGRCKCCAETVSLATDKHLAFNVRICFQPVQGLAKNAVQRYCSALPILGVPGLNGQLILVEIDIAPLKS